MSTAPSPQALAELIVGEVFKSPSLRDARKRATALGHSIPRFTRRLSVYDNATAYFVAWCTLCGAALFAEERDVVRWNNPALLHPCKEKPMTTDTKRNEPAKEYGKRSKYERALRKLAKRQRDRKARLGRRLAEAILSTLNLN